MNVERPGVRVFDVNETLLDLGGLRGAFGSIMGTNDFMGEWFARMLHGSLVANHTNRYRPVGEIGAEALHIVASKHGMSLDDGQAEAVIDVMRQLRPHPDVSAGLAALGEAGFRMITLTNGSSAASADQVKNAGLSEFFEATLSVEEVRRFKPAPEVYIMASVRLGVELDEMMMVAAHDWDILGARTVGVPGAYLTRPGAVWSLPDPPAEIVVPDVRALAETLIDLT